MHATCSGTAKQEPHLSPRTPSGTIVNMSQTDFLPTGPELTVVVPVYNEEEGLAALFSRLYPALDALGATYEVIFINDGSRDKSAALLAQQFRARPDTTRVILLNGNYGQHMVILE